MAKRKKRTVATYDPIRDLREEVNKLRQEIEDIKKSLSSIYSTISPFEKIGPITSYSYCPDIPETLKDKTFDDFRKLSPIFCNHANECPAVCPCDKECYCWYHTCKSKKRMEHGVFE